PAQVEDALTAWRWAVENADDLGFAPGRIGVGGDSAGGNLAAVVAQAAKREGFTAPALQLLIYPVTDWAAKGGSMESCGNVYPLTSEIMDWFAGHYLNSTSEMTDLRVSPLNEADLPDLAPAIIVTAGFDPLRDQGAAYAEMLESAGVSDSYRCEDSPPHAYTAMTGAIPAARRACQKIAQDVKAALY